MDKEFLDYYNRELAFILDMGSEFAAAHPQEAGKLALQAGRCEDPHVERLLQGFAFLTARIRKKIDDEYPEVADALLSILYPHYQRPIPSMAIVQFSPPADPTKSVGGLTVARETVLVSPLVSGLPCRFRTAYPVKLWPVSVTQASLTPDRVTIAGKPSRAISLLRLSLKCNAAEDWPSLGGFDSLRFFLDGAEPVPSSLYECLLNNLCEVWIQGTRAGQPQTIVLPAGSVRPVGFGPEERLLPYPVRSFDGYRILQEFFALPAKFLYFDLRDLDTIARAKLSGPVEILFFLSQPPKTEVNIRAENFQLGCTPVVNLFTMSAEPIRLNQLQTKYTVVPKYGEVGAHEIFSIDRVVSVGSYLDTTVEFRPFYASRLETNEDRREAFWFVSRRRSLRKDDDGIEVDLEFTDAGFSPRSPTSDPRADPFGIVVETLTAHITCTNRDLPTRLPFGGEQADFSLESEVGVGRIRLLTRPTKPLRPPLGRSAQWRLISQLGLNHLSLIEDGHGPEVLRQLLSLYDFSNSAVTRKMIDGIVGVNASQVASRVARDPDEPPSRPRFGIKPKGVGHRLGNTLSLGMQITVQFDEDAFAGSGAFLLASVLERFLGAYVTINSFTQLIATSKQREGEWKRWQPRCGDRTLL